MDEQSKCGLCGEPMPTGEEMFKYHGYSGPCPKPPLERKTVQHSDRWYVDCFCSGALGSSFPVNTYYHKNIDRVLQTARKVLESEVSGIDRVSISRTTLGQAPIEVA